MATPRRTCVGCRQVDEQPALVRVVLVDGRLVPDLERQAPGRGAWVHLDRDCWAAAVRGGFARSFRRRVDASQLTFPGDGPGA